MWELVTLKEKELCYFHLYGYKPENNFPEMQKAFRSK